MSAFTAVSLNRMTSNRLMQTQRKNDDQIHLRGLQSCAPLHYQCHQTSPPTQDVFNKQQTLILLKTRLQVSE